MKSKLIFFTKLLSVASCVILFGCNSNEHSEKKISQDSTAVKKKNNKDMWKDLGGNDTTVHPLKMPDVH